MEPLYFFILSVVALICICYLLYRTNVFKNNLYESIVVILLIISIDYLSYERTSVMFEKALSDVSICEKNPEKEITASYKIG